jgi:glucosyl-3-phosphoglycerate synthase
VNAVVVIPARNEELVIGACIEALAAQTVGAGAFEIVLVADACTDATAPAARATARERGLSLRVLLGAGIGSGAARRLGMDAAAARLLALGAPDGLIATTDADSTPAPDWLERQLDHLACGARVIAGLIELEPAEAARLPSAVVRRREADAAVRFARLSEADPTAGHHHFAGASLGITADAYRQVGGIDAAVALEDEALLVRLQAERVPVLHASDVRVRTSARADGRARRGLSVDLAVSLWLERRRFVAEQFPLDRLARAKGRTTVTVIVPTKDCAGTIAGVLTDTIAPLRGVGLVDEAVLVDAGSADGTAQRASATGCEWLRVVQQDELLAEFGPALGKGDAMWRALHASSGELVCFLDGDTENPDPRHLQGLLGPLLTDGSIELVKGAFDRPLKIGADSLTAEGGRVTELMARPLLNLHEPRLAGFAQPLAGEFAARRSLLEALPFPVGYGVEIALLIDALRARGLEALAECDLGTRQNRHQPLRALGEMAFAVLAAVERRLDGPRAPTGGQYLKPWDDGSTTRVAIEERPPLASIRARAA